MRFIVTVDHNKIPMLMSAEINETCKKYLEKKYLKTRNF